MRFPRRIPITCDHCHGEGRAYRPRLSPMGMRWGTEDYLEANMRNQLKKMYEDLLTDYKKIYQRNIKKTSTIDEHKKFKEEYDFYVKDAEEEHEKRIEKPVCVRCDGKKTIKKWKF